MKIINVTGTERNYILRSDIAPDTQQPRKAFDAAKLQAFADSFGSTAENIHTDLLVRDDPAKPGKFILISGERRWRAAKLAGFERVPCRVASVAEVADRLKLQLTENMQRENMSALEEAKGAARLLEERRKVDEKFNVTALGKELGKSRAAAYELLSLLKLSPLVAKALESGNINPSQATRIALVPLVTGQQELLDQILRDRERNLEISVRRLESTIAEFHAISLKGAPFKTDKVYDGDHVLFSEGDPKHPTRGVHVPLCEMGKCTECPHRTGNLPNWPDGKNPDTCLVPQCFRNKSLAAATVRGGRTLSPEDYAKTSSNYTKANDWNSWGSAGNCEASKAWGQKKPKPVTTVDGQGRVVEVFLKEDAKAAMIANGVSFDKPNTPAKAKTPAATGKEQAKAAAREAEKELREKVVTAVLPRLRKGLEKAKETDVLRLLLEYADLYWKGILYKLHGIKSPAKCDAGQLRSILVEITLRDLNDTFVHGGGYEDAFVDACKMAGIDLKKEEHAAFAAEAAPKTENKTKTKKAKTK